MNPLDAIFYSFCLHCNARSTRLFCRSCIDLLTLIEPQYRCVRCFSEVENECLFCRRKRPKHFTAALFDPASPMVRLIAKMKHGRLRIYEKSLHAYLFLQWQNLEWDTDVITYIPINFFEQILQGPSLSMRMSKSFAKQIQKPVVNLFDRNGKKTVVEDQKVEGKKILILSENHVPIAYIRALYAKKAKEVNVLQLIYSEPK